jgi:hypothetical protein
MKPTIVLVHLGDNFIEYLNVSIRQIKRFNDCCIYLIISEKHFNLIKEDVKLVATEKLKKSRQHYTFLETNQLEKSFRDGFWKSATERFFFINDLIEYYNLENVFHFENDVMIYCDLKKTLNVCRQNEFQMAATFDNDKRCIPGFVYFKNSEIASKLNSFMLLYENKNDMELIALFNNKFNVVAYLPVVPPNYKFSLISHLRSFNLSKYSKNFNSFASIFDAAAIGQYIGGIDPRNNGNQNTHNFINESALYNVSDFKFIWEEDDLGRNVPFAYYKQIKIRINNLHIHSKNLEEFL